MEAVLKLGIEGPFPERSGGRARNRPGRTALIRPKKAVVCWGLPGHDADSSGLRLKIARRIAEYAQETSPFLLGTVTGACLALLVTAPQGGAPDRGGQGCRRQFQYLLAAQTCFGEVFERVRTDYVEKPDDTKLMEGAIKRHDLVARSAFALHECEGLARHAGDDPGRVRRARLSKSRWKTASSKVVAPIDDTARRQGRHHVGAT